MNKIDKPCKHCDDSGIVAVVGGTPTTCVCEIGENALAANPWWERMNRNRNRRHLAAMDRAEKEWSCGCEDEASCPCKGGAHCDPL